MPDSELLPSAHKVAVHRQTASGPPVPFAFGSGPELHILSTTDTVTFRPLIEAFQRDNPAVSLRYTVASSQQVFSALYDEDLPFDLVISSAMDLQMKLANDGFAAPHPAARLDGLPDWAHWRNEVFAFTREPAVLVVSQAAFTNRSLPRNRAELIAIMREDPDLFRGRIGTYDTRVSGLGYLFATQDSRNSESYWQLTEVMGRLDPHLYCCSGEMISDVASGDLVLAYNVLGSYAAARVRNTPGLEIVELDDYVSVMLRTALIPKTAQNPTAGAAMIDFLLTETSAELLAEAGLPPVVSPNVANDDTLRPIRLGPGLLVFLDRMRRETFLRSWTGSILQE